MAALDTFVYDGDHKLTGDTFANLVGTYAYDRGVISGLTLGSGSEAGASPSVRW